MAGSVGAKHSPLNDIKILRDLVGRYHLGFPILRELLQNADDAGASRLGIGFAPGVGSSSHPLLQGPAIFAFNNGPFTKRNEWAIQHIGSTDKGNQQSAIGKFGYGLKSVFHLCEAFFYLYSEQSPSGDGGVALADATLFNPWKGGEKNYHPEWDGFSPQDAAAIEKELRPWCGSERWFALWLPLRVKDHLGKVEPIARHTHDDQSQPPTFLRDLAALAKDFASTLPMLRSLEDVRVLLPTRRDGPLEQALRVQLETGAQRRRFQGQGIEQGAWPLQGRMTITRSGLEPQAAVFSGEERFLATPEFRQFQARNEWPKEDEDDLETGEITSLPDKALPHAAVLFTATPARRGGELAVSNAVFLAVGDRSPSEPCPGVRDIDVTLHGYYFVKSDRTGIEWGDPRSAGDDAARALRLEWNNRLLAEGTLPCLLRALDGFARAAELSDADLTSLTGALSSSGFLRDHLTHVCSQHQWAYCLKPDGGEWRLIPGDAPIYLLPKLPSNEMDTHREVFPALDEICQKTAISFQDRPRIAATAVPHPWREEEIKALLESLPAREVFSDAKKLHYLSQFLNMNADLVRDSAPAQDCLVQVLRRALHAVGPASLDTEDFRTIVGKIRGNRIMSVAVEPPARGAVEGTFSFLAGLESSVLILPQALTPQSFAGPAAATEGPLDLNEAVGLLAALASPPEELESASFLHLRTGLSTQVIRAAGDNPKMRERCGDLKLFRTWDGHQRADVVLSWHELERSSLDGWLFVQRQNEDRGLADVLQEALSGDTIRVVRTEVAEALLGDDGPSRCGYAESIRVVMRGVGLAGFDRRKRLVQALLRGMRAHETGDMPVLAIRYLLHGNAAERSNTATLLVETTGTDVWARLAAQALGDEEWRVVPSAAAGEIAQNRWEDLALHRVNVNSVTDLIREAGPDRIDCEALSDADRATMLREIDDLEVLRDMPMHRDAAGRLRSVGEREYLESSYQLDDEFSDVVNLIKVVPGLREKQERLLPGRYWGPQFAVKVALDQPEPGRFWRAILRAIEGVRQRWSWGNELLIRLRDSAWLPLAERQWAKPSDVIHLPGLEEELARLASLANGAFFDTGMLHSDVRNHAGLQALKQVVLPGTDEALADLGLIITEVPALANFAIGPLAPEDFDLKVFLEAFVSAPPEVMRCRDLLAALARNVSSEKCTSILVPQLLTGIPAHRLVNVLNFLAERHSRAPVHARPALDEMHERFLRPAASSDQGPEILAKIRLKNQRGRWRDPAELSWGYYNLDGEHVLDEEQARILGRLLPDPRGEAPAIDLQVASHSQLDRDIDYSDGDFDDAAETLREYFEPWRGACPDEVIGGFLAILGDYPAIRKLAQMYLGQRDVDVIRDQIEWAPLSDWMGGGGEDVHRVMQQHRFLVELAQPDLPFEVLNLLGEIMKVPLRADFENLVVGKVFFSGVGTRTNKVSLRSVRPEDYETKELSGFLRETSRVICQKVYHQPAPSFDQFWEQLEHSPGVQLEVTQVRLLEHLLTSLKQFRLHTDPVLNRLFRKWDDAHQLEAELGLLPDAQVREKRRREAECLSREAREKLRDLLTGDPGVADRFLEAVRSSIHRDYQYQTGSVPFELFQNADDAVVELEELRGTGNRSLEPAELRCVISWDDSRLNFFHWGRPLNEFRHPARPSADFRAQGFHQDLEKMLMIGASDKGVNPAQAAVTGKFGMGFKSVFLLSDRPRVLSHRLAFEVIGAVYPKRLMGEGYAALEEGLTENAPDRRAGTAIELRFRPGVEAAFIDDMERFTRLAPVLLAFARRINQLVVRPPEGPDRSITWCGAPVLGLADVSTGRLDSEAVTEALPSRGLVLRGGKGTLLLGLAARGTESLPEDVPGLWVTAPTEDLKGLGFAINGLFDLDVGRAQVARISPSNDDLADQLGTELGGRLVDLYHASEADWDGFRESLDFAHDLVPYQFWHSLLETLSKPFRLGGRQDPGSTALALVKRALWKDAQGVGRLLAECPVLPSGLWGDYRCLVAATGVRYEVTGLLGQESTFTVLASLPAFRTRVRRSEAVLDSIVSGLPIGVVRGAESLDLVTCLRWELEPDYIVSPDMAASLDRVLTEETLESLGHGTSAERVEYSELHGLLDQLRFQGRDGERHLARELLVGGAPGLENTDEDMRSRFAPDQHLLSSEYSDGGLAFFKLCRREMEAPSERLAEWGVSADEEEHKVAFLRYLLDGDLGQQIMQRLRGGLKTTWLQDLDESELLDSAVDSPMERRRLLANLYLFPPSVGPDGIWPAGVAVEDPGVALRSLSDWWRENGGEQLRQYEKRLYGDHPPALSRDFLGDRTKRSARKAWLELFVLGAAHRLGRTQDEQHRGFLDLCRDKGWFEVFAAPRGEFNAAAWMGVVHSYLDAQIDRSEFYHWLGLFVPIFQLSWWLDDYVELFLDADRLFADAAMSFDEFMSPASASALQGGGIEAPPLGRTLGIGANFVLRELARQGLVKHAAAFRHSFVPSGRVRELAAKLGCPGMDDSVRRWEQSGSIADFLAKHLAPELKTFGNAFDIPLTVVARDFEIQDEIFHATLVDPSEGEDDE